ncbi:MAG: hypothetical protein VYA35_00265, partial [Pseudomonadota bacterium]|nr:hypothetical protein [Pseudomonadota bacterium]
MAAGTVFGKDVTEAMDSPAIDISEADMAAAADKAKAATIAALKRKLISAQKQAVLGRGVVYCNPIVATTGRLPSAC